MYEKADLSMSVTPGYVMRFDEIDDAIALAGAKGANLARLAAAGLPVPAGFCVTTAAYDALIDDPEVRERIRGLDDLDPADKDAVAEAGAALRERIRGRPFPEEARRAIAEAFEAMKSETGAEAVSVRSSATVEDLPEASVAGQHDTYLNVREAEALVGAVRDCMASLFTDRAIVYRANSGVPHEGAALAVVVQRMLHPGASGILFTADPATSNRRVASIDAGFGLGEALVSGKVSADHVRVDERTGEILGYEVGDKRVAVRALPEGGTETVELEPRRRNARALGDEQARALAKMGRRIERLFGSPQDVEWALEDGALYVLQARPITALFPLPSPAPEDGRLHVYLSLGHVQAMSEAMPPLVRDFWGDSFRESVEVLGLDALQEHWAVEAGGRVYVDATPLLRVAGLRGALPKGLSSLNEPASAGLRDLLDRRGEELRGGTLAALSAFAGAARRGAATLLVVVPKAAGRVVGAFVGEPADPEREEAWYDGWGKRVAARVYKTDDPAGRARAVFDAIAVLDLADVYPRVVPLYAAFAAGGMLEWLFPDASDDLNAVGGGFEHEIVTRINQGLGDLADVAREHPAVAGALRDGKRLEEVAAAEGGGAFLKALDGYLDEFGHRATGELDLSRPRWREDPSGLLGTVRANLAHEGPGGHREHLRRLEREAQAASDRLERRAGHGLLGPVRKRLVRRLIRTYRGWIWLREHPKHGIAHLFEAGRENLLEAGERLAADGRLDRPEDVWFLRKDELLAALEGAPLDVDVVARRAEFGRHAGMDAPPLLTSEGEAPIAGVGRDAPEGALVGTPVSGGIVEGIARVVRDPAKTTVERGEILVAPSSDPGWTPLFLNAAGLVTEVGGRISHGALVAREYGLPAVVSVAGATTRIQTGQRVRVDGTKGFVEILQ